MKINTEEAEKHFEEIIQSIIDKKEETVIILKDGEPIVEISPYQKEKRIGAAREEMRGFDLSQEEFDILSKDEIELINK